MPPSTLVPTRSAKIEYGTGLGFIRSSRIRPMVAHLIRPFFGNTKMTAKRGPQSGRGLSLSFSTSCTGCGLSCLCNRCCRSGFICCGMAAKPFRPQHCLGCDNLFPRYRHDRCGVKQHPKDIQRCVNLHRFHKHRAVPSIGFGDILQSYSPRLLWFNSNRFHRVTPLLSNRVRRTCP
jgi:hypothetical protein